MVPLTESMAQVPSGIYLYAAPADWRAPRPPGCGGLFLIDPASPGVPVAITGLPPEITGCGSGLTDINGASWVLEDPATGDIFANGSLENGPVSVYRLRLDAATASATVAARYELGQRTRGAVNRDAVMLPDGRLLLFLGPTRLQAPGPFAGQALGILDPGRPPTDPAAFTPVPVTGLPTQGLLLSGAVSADGSRAILAVSGFGPPTTQLYGLSLPGGGTATLLATVGIASNKLLREPDGPYLLGGFSATTEALRRIDLATGAVTTFPQFTNPDGFVGGLGVDPVSGDLLIASGDLNFGTQTNVSRVYRLAGRTTTSPLVPFSSGPVGGWGSAFAGFVTTSALHPYGFASGAGDGAQWVFGPNGGGAPALGNARFGLEVTVPAGAGGAAALAGFDHGAAQPLSGTWLWVGGPTLVPMAISINGRTATLPAPIPAAPALRGAELFLQTFFVGTSAGALRASPGLRLRLR